MSPHLPVQSSDTSLHCNDSGGAGCPILFLNGAFGTQHDWARVLGRLDPRYRTVTFDARGRGKSRRSKTYSFAADLDDVAAVVAATGLRRHLIVGWSHGAALAVRYAAQHPDEVTGLVLVDGAFPISMLAEADKEQARRTFRRLAPLMRVMAVFNRSARMSGSEAADLNIELDDLAASLTYDYDIIHCPIEFIVGSKPHMGATDEQCRTMRASITALVEQHGNISLFATLPASHNQILTKHPDIVATAIDRVYAALTPTAPRGGAIESPRLTATAQVVLTGSLRVSGAACDID
jgi:pimeloyl-ACP methyl ester carboxylesterase